MMKIIDYKPKNEIVDDGRPQNDSIFDAKPISLADGSFTDQLYDTTIQIGQPMGLLLSITYPEQLTVTTRLAP